jgi:3-dehydroquinate dehydratase I
LKICTTIASSSSLDLEKQIKQAFADGTNFVEIRFDFLPLSEMQDSLRIANGFRNKAVFTLRPDSQKGKFSGSADERVNWLKELSLSRPMLLDVEYDTLINHEELVDFLTDHKARILVSWHDFERTPANESLLDLIGQMRIYGNFLKIVTTAEHIQDCIRLLDLYKVVTNLDLILFAMGELGVLSRILCTIYGNAPFTYASLGKSVVPGQLTLLEMRKLYEGMNL